jgi:hypothetical protein
MAAVTCLMSELLKPLGASLSVPAVAGKQSKQAFVGQHGVAECAARNN